MQPRLFAMASGYLCLEFDAYGSELRRSVCTYLVDGLGFGRRGEVVDGWDEGIAQSFCLGEVVLEAGWSHWADGDYLQSVSPAGDELLRLLFAAIGPDLLFRPL
ncbi:hypothetical protein [Pseudomonas chlororaphis]|uniref:hypothetical protein n=1 Tax=Pseudomonas chlororaphis TaxID=587753 RepID=UPI000BE41B76|nr:hypothetical protein [Pseudomonas chlororaphis]